MKKLLSFALSLVLMMSLSVSAFAATEVLGTTDFDKTLNGRTQSVGRIVDTGRKTYRVVGIYYPEESKKELTHVNAARRKEGLPALKWEPKLEEAAIQRALEQYVSWSHTRPDGTSWRTVDSYANGENLAMGVNAYFDAETVTEGWLDSPDHYTNIMGTNDVSKYFVSMAAACVETDKGIIWVQLFHADKDAAAADASAANSTSTSAKTPTASASASATASAITAKSIVSDLGKAKASGTNVSLTTKTTDKLELAVIKAAADWATSNKKTVLLSVPTLTSTGKSNQGMFTMNPASFTKNKNAVKTGVYVDKASVKDATASLTAKYPKAKFSVIKLAQSGNYGGQVSIGAKADLSKLNTKSLLFYHYDAKIGKLTKLDLGKAGYSIDKNNYLKFAVTKGGYIVVTDTAF